MGAGFSSPQLAGAQFSTFGSPPPALPTSYAFKPGNTNQLGFTATFVPGQNVPGGPPTIAAPTITVPLKAGGSSVVACGPTAISNLPASTSITCPIANSLIGVGTANFVFTVEATPFTETSTYLIAFTTIGSTPEPTPIGKGPSIPKNCRPVTKTQDFGPPDLTFTGSGPTTTATTTAATTPATTTSAPFATLTGS